jgi:hypothetical protein
VRVISKNTVVFTAEEGNVKRGDIHELSRHLPGRKDTVSSLDIDH